MNYSALDFAYDVMYVSFVALLGLLFFMGYEPEYLGIQRISEPDTASVTVQTVHQPVTDTVDYIDTVKVIPYTKKETPNTKGVTLEMCMQHCPYPVLAFTTVVAESGWYENKSHLAKVVNNNTGMMIPVTRHYACSIKDTAAIRKQLNLSFGVDYDIYRLDGKIIRNTLGDTMIAYNNKWAIFLTPEDCAADLGEYQRRYVTPEQAKTPRTYLKRLRQMNYFTNSDEAKGYSKYWLQINATITKHFNVHNHRSDSLMSDNTL